MWKAFYSNMEPTLPLLAMASFIGAFVLVLIRAYAFAQTQPEQQRAVEQLPLFGDAAPTNDSEAQHHG